MARRTLSTKLVLAEFSKPLKQFENHEIKIFQPIFLWYSSEPVSTSNSILFLPDTAHCSQVGKILNLHIFT